MNMEIIANIKQTRLNRVELLPNCFTDLPVTTPILPHCFDCTKQWSLRRKWGKRPSLFFVLFWPPLLNNLAQGPYVVYVWSTLRKCFKNVRIPNPWSRFEWGYLLIILLLYSYAIFMELFSNWTGITYFKQL